MNEIDALKDSFREFLADRCSPSAVLGHVGGDNSAADLWQAVAELGWIGLSVPEELGGLGLGAAANAALYSELGRAIAPIPILSAALVAEAIAYAGSEEQQVTWLPKLLSGENRATLSPPAPYLAPSASVSGRDEAITISGRAINLLDAQCATIALVAARDQEGAVQRILIDLEADGVEIVSVEMTDRTRTLGWIEFGDLDLPASRVLGGSAKGGEIESRLARHAALAIACDSIGGSEAVFEQTIEYLKTRQQFGRAIGSFQALKHRCADHKMSIIASAAMLEEAVRLADENAEAEAEIAAAKAYSSDVFLEVARDAIQLHGGIGFTFEYPCHLYLKRANLNAELFGNRSVHLDGLFNQLAERVQS